MNWDKIQAFFGWCTFLNFLGLIYLTFVFFNMDWVHEMHSRWFLGPKEDFVTYLYYIISIYKMFWWILNVIPYLAIRFMRGNVLKD